MAGSNESWLQHLSTARYRPVLPGAERLDKPFEPTAILALFPWSGLQRLGSAEDVISQNGRTMQPGLVCVHPYVRTIGTGDSTLVYRRR